MRTVRVTSGVDNIRALSDLKAITFRETYAHGNDPAELERHIAVSFSTASISAELANPNSITLWTTDGSGPVAYLKVNQGGAQTEPGLERGLEIQQIYVRSSAQGKGIGNHLIREATAIAVREGLDFLWLGVWENNTSAIEVYRHLGFSDFGEHVFRIGDDLQRDVLMRRDITTPP